jgi:hypothetical protein
MLLVTSPVVARAERVLHIHGMHFMRAVVCPSTQHAYGSASCCFLTLHAVSVDCVLLCTCLQADLDTTTAGTLA